MGALINQYNDNWAGHQQEMPTPCGTPSTEEQNKLRLGYKQIKVGI